MSPVFVQAAVSVAEEKLSRTEAELQQVRTSIKQCEVLLDNYKIQVLDPARTLSQQPLTSFWASLL